MTLPWRRASARIETRNPAEIAPTTATPTVGFENAATRPLGDGAHRPGRRHRHDPGDDHPADDEPVHDAAGAAEAGAHDPAGDDLRRGEREAEVRGGEDRDIGLVSAENPCGDWISVTRVPSVLITRQPPEKVPSAIAVAQTILTQTGTPADGASWPPATSVSTTTPIVFCASFVP